MTAPNTPSRHQSSQVQVTSAARPMASMLLGGSCLLMVALVAAALVRRWRQTSQAKRSAASLLWQPSASHGFLPAVMPGPHADLYPAEALLASLPALVKAGSVRAACGRLPHLDMASLLTACATPLEAELLAERCALVYAFLSYAYLRDGDVGGDFSAPSSTRPHRLPRVLAVPFHTAATFVGRAPALDYVATVLANGDDPVGAPGVATFSGLSDERYFYELHVRVERAAAPAVGAMLRACDALDGGGLDASALTHTLEEVARGVAAMAALLPEMTAGCRPHVFHDAIRQSLASVDAPVLFEGVRTSTGAPLTLQLGGASGAQSAVLPCVDALLGIGHRGRHELAQWSADKGTLTHLPPPHRALLQRLRATAPGSAAAVERALHDLADAASPTPGGGGCGGEAAAAADEPEAQARALRAAHAACIDALSAFRKAHFALVREFIMKPASAQLGPDSPVSVASALVGTGGSELGGFLSGRLLDTARAALADSPTRWRRARAVA